MIRFITLSLIGLLLGICFMSLAIHYPAYAFFDLGEEYLRVSLYPMLLLLVLGLLLTGFLLRFLGEMGRFPGMLRNRWSRGAKKRSQERLLKGLMALERGEWRIAAHYLEAHSSPGGHECLLRCLGAARAAWRQGDQAGCDRFLQRAQDCFPEAGMYTGLLRARMRASDGDWKTSAELLKQLSGQYPDNHYLRKFLMEASMELGDWPAVLKQLEKLRLPREAGDRIRVQAFQGLFREAGLRAEPERLEQHWRDLPRRLRVKPQLVGAYTREALRLGAAGHCEPLLRTVLKREFHPELAGLYARLEQGPPEPRLAFLERLLEEHPEEPALLEAVALLCVRLELWGKARGLYETALKIQPTPGLYLALAHLLEHRKQDGSVLEYYRQGLEIAAGRQEHALPTDKRDSGRPESLEPQKNIRELDFPLFTE